MTPRQQQIKQFIASTPFADAALEPLAGDASFRRYIRVRKANKTAMLMDAPPEKEDVRPYLKVARHLHAQGCSAPEVIAEDAALGLVLLEDLGDDSFTSLLRRGAASDVDLYSEAIDLLADWYTQSSAFASPSSLSLPSYNHALLMQEVRLFSDWYLPQVTGKAEAAALGAEYLELWDKVLREADLSTSHFVHRDYHADNLMWLPGRSGTKRVGLLDFQDAVYGDAAYDLVSLLEDARRDVPRELAQSMTERYLAATGTPKTAFLAAYAILGAQRNSKIVGIFVRLAARDSKRQYLHYLPRVWSYLEQDLAHPALADISEWTKRHIVSAWRGAIDVRYNAADLALTA